MGKGALRVYWSGHFSGAMGYTLEKRWEFGEGPIMPYPLTTMHGVDRTLHAILAYKYPVFIGWLRAIIVWTTSKCSVDCYIRHCILYIHKL